MLKTVHFSSDTQAWNTWGSQVITEQCKRRYNWERAQTTRKQKRSREVRKTRSWKVREDLKNGRLKLRQKKEELNRLAGGRGLQERKQFIQRPRGTHHRVSLENGRWVSAAGAVTEGRGQGASGGSENRFIHPGLFSKTRRDTTVACHDLMRFAFGKDCDSSRVEERLQEGMAAVGTSVQPSRAESKTAFAKAETVAVR